VISRLLFMIDREIFTGELNVVMFWHFCYRSLLLLCGFPYLFMGRIVSCMYTYSLFCLHDTNVYIRHWKKPVLRLSLNSTFSHVHFSWLNTTMMENRVTLNPTDLDDFDKVNGTLFCIQTALFVK
jgi:hypothetical protein